LLVLGPVFWELAFVFLPILYLLSVAFPRSWSFFSIAGGGISSFTLTSATYSETLELDPHRFLVYLRDLDPLPPELLEGRRLPLS